MEEDKNEAQSKNNICDESFPEESKLKEHEDLKERPHKCYECSKSFSTKNELRRHYYKHKQGSAQCYICGKTLSCKSALKEHLNMHNGIRPFQCDVCNKTFVQSSNLAHHKKLHTAPGEKDPYSCNKCEESFRSRTYLVIHKRKHEGKKPIPYRLIKHLKLPKDFKYGYGDSYKYVAGIDGYDLNKTIEEELVDQAVSHVSDSIKVKDLNNKEKAR